MSNDTQPDNVSQVLYVEDNPAHVRLVQRTFETQRPDIELIIAETLARAREILATSQPHLIIADYRLPDGLGTDLTDLSNDSIPMVVLTSQGSETIAVDAMKRGVLDYIVKNDESLRTLPQIAGRVLREWRLRQEKQQIQHLLQLLLNSMPYRVYVTDRDWNILLANERHFNNDLPIDVGHCQQGDNFQERCRLSDKLESARYEIVTFLSQISPSLTESVDLEFQLSSPDDEPSQWFRILVTPLLGETRAHYLLQMEEITARKLSELRSQENAIHQARFESLSPREREVVQMVADGDPNKVIAARLHLSDRTVEKHRASGMKKLKARSVADLVKVVVAVSN